MLPSFMSRISIYYNEKYSLEDNYENSYDKRK